MKKCIMANCIHFAIIFAPLLLVSQCSQVWAMTYLNDTPINHSSTGMAPANASNTTGLLFNLDGTSGNSTEGANNTKPMAYVDSQQQQGQLSSIDSSEQFHLNKTHLEQLYSEYSQFTSSTYLSERLFYALGCALLIVLSLFGNLLVCKVCLQNMTKTNALIMSLAASDLMMTIFNIPFNFFRLLEYSWPFGSVMCFVVNFVQYLVVYNSSYTMAIIAIQRYYSVCCCLPTNNPGKGSKTLVGKIFTHNQYGKLCSMKAIFTTIFVIWLVSSIISTFFTFSSTIVERNDIFSLILEIYISKLNLQPDASPQHQDNSTDKAIRQLQQTSPSSASSLMLRCTNPVPASVDEFFEQRFSIKADFAKSVAVFVTQYFIPLSISCCLYIRIGKTISRQGKAFKGNSTAQIQQQKKRRRIFMLFLVVAVFAICWLPIHLFHIAIDAGLFNYNYQVFMMVQWIATSSVIYNPFIYCWLNKSFRKAAFRVFGFCCVKEEDGERLSALATTSSMAMSRIEENTRKV